MRTPRAAGFIASFETTPLEISRVNKDPSIFLREWAAFPPHRSSIFDLHTYEGKVLPKALDKATYQCKLFIIYLSSYLTSILVPNGASMRPNGQYQQGLVRRLAGRDWIVYSVPKCWLSPWTESIYVASSAYVWPPETADTPLPKELILVHEHTDHYSMQPAVEMSLEGRDERPKILSFSCFNHILDLNQRISQFLQASGTLYTTEHWLATYKLPAWSARKAYCSRSVMDNNTFVG
jgi:hypothetical protein